MFNANLIVIYVSFKNEQTKENVYYISQYSKESWKWLFFVYNI